MMWAAISNECQAYLVHVPGNLTAQRYRDEIIQPYHMHVIHRQTELFQQDNARPHTARLAKSITTKIPISKENSKRKVP